jgi:hypothetical protein
MIYLAISPAAEEIEKPVAVTTQEVVKTPRTIPLVANMVEIPEAEESEVDILEESEEIESDTHEPEESEEPVEPETPKTPVKKYFNVPLSEELQDHIFKLCEKYDIEPALVISMIKKESNFRANAMGDKGRSYGLMQIQQRWHKARMKKLGCTDLLDPFQNVTVGIDILAGLISDKKPIEWSLMAYNGGGAYANRKWSNGEVSSYVKTVLSNKEKLENERRGTV